MPNQQDDKRLFLLDAFALIYRAYYAFIKNPITNSKGMNTSASYGFTNYLNDLMRKEKPTHIAVVFDAPGQTDRAVEFEFYKANREAMPEDIRSALPYIKQIIDAFNIPRIELSGYEADDLIGTLAKQKEKEGYKVFMVTPDKDFAQLVSENIFMYKPSRQGNGVEILGVPEIKEKWEVEDPLQVIDILGMWGDAVDNIPGIPGVGEKTAKKFIKEYGSMEGLFENIDKLKGKMKEKVAANVEQGLISKQLATIILDAPIELKCEDLIISEPNKEKLTELFTELEFRTLGKRILGSEFSVNQVVKGGQQIDMFGGEVSLNEDVDIVAEEDKGKTIENTEHEYLLLETEQQINELISMIEKKNIFAFDTETTGLDVLTVDIVGLSISIEKGKGYYLPLNVEDEKSMANLQSFKPFFEDETIEKIGQNIKYDAHILANYDIDLKGKLFDTMLAHYLLQPDLKHGMDYLAETYLGYTPISITELIGKKGKNQLKFSDVPLEKQTEYAAEDADITWQLSEIFKPLCKEREVENLLQTVELPLVPVLTNMERNGVNIDVDFLQNYADELNEDLIKYRTNIFEKAGLEFNMDSPKQLGEVLFDKMEIPYKGKKTKTGQYSTSEDNLKKIKNDESGIVADILEYRQINKLRSTYVEAIPKLVNENTGRVHSTFSQAVAATGRLASVNPNLQNIPIRTERGRKVREAFIPKDEDYILLAADYSQIELRLMAEMSQDDVMMDAFVNGKDIHTTTAAKVFGVAEEEVTREMRSHAKVVNFGIIYGVSAFGLAQQTGLSRTESKEIIESYFKTYPKLKSFMDDNVNEAREKGYVETILGRRRILKDINSKNAILRGHAERNAVNAPVQGSAADMIKVAMINIHNEMQTQKMQSKMILQVHDELVFDVLKSELEQLKEIVKTGMETALPNLKVPIIAEMGIGENWLEAH
ncbi:MAG: DNA polymerase I [Chitinophagales bacterium]